MYQYTNWIVLRYKLVSLEECSVHLWQIKALVRIPLSSAQPPMELSSDCIWSATRKQIYVFITAISYRTTPSKVGHIQLAVFGSRPSSYSIPLAAALPVHNTPSGALCESREVSVNSWAARRCSRRCYGILMPQSITPKPSECSHQIYLGGHWDVPS